jgi:DNA-binding MarR family transcriptional regulator
MPVPFSALDPSDISFSAELFSTVPHGLFSGQILGYDETVMKKKRSALDPEEARTWAAYSRAARRLFAQLDREVQRDAGLPMSYWELLRHLADAPERAMRMSELAEVTRSAPSRLTHAVSQLEADGLVCRRQCTSDRRGSHAELTDKGAEALAAAGVAAARSLREHFFGSLTPDELAQLRGLSETLLAHLSTTCETAPGRRAKVSPGL